jgi:hypothetical protein
MTDDWGIKFAVSTMMTDYGLRDHELRGTNVDEPPANTSSPTLPPPPQELPQEPPSSKPLSPPQGPPPSDPLAAYQMNVEQALVNMPAWRKRFGATSLAQKTRELDMDAFYLAAMEEGLKFGTPPVATGERIAQAYFTADVAQIERMARREQERESEPAGSDAVTNSMLASSLWLKYFGCIPSEFMPELWIRVTEDLGLQDQFDKVTEAAHSDGAPVEVAAALLWVEYISAHLKQEEAREAATAPEDRARTLCGQLGQAYKAWAEQFNNSSDEWRASSEGQAVHRKIEAFVEALVIMHRVLEPPNDGELRCSG